MMELFNHLYYKLAHTYTHAQCVHRTHRTSRSFSQAYFFYQTRSRPKKTPPTTTTVPPATSNLKLPACD